MSDDTASLYRQWWSMLPSFFTTMQPAAAPASAAPVADADTAAAAAIPSDWLAFMQQAPTLAGDAFGRLFDVWTPLLGQSGALVDGLRRLADTTDANVKQLQDAWSAAYPLAAGGSLSNLTSLPAWPGWATPLLFAAGGAAPSERMNPLQVGADRTFGALADAIGARPLRELQEAWQVLLRVDLERRAAQAAYLGLVGKAWSTGTRRLVDRLEGMRRNGEQVSSMVALLKLWAGEADAALHAQMQAPEGLAATAQLVRASTGRRAETQRLVGLLSQALNVPTRAEVDEGYREIQELKREIRRLKKALPVDADGQPMQASPQTREPAAEPPQQGAQA